jgi:hypothetical protein
VSLDRLLQLLPAQLHLPHDLGVGADPPLREGASQHVLLHQTEQVGHDTLCVRLKETFTGDQPDTSENLHTHLAAGYSSYQIYCIFLFLNVVSPYTEDVTSSLHIYVVVHSGYMCGKRLLIVSFELFFDLHRMLILISHLLYHLALLYLFMVLLPLQILPLMFLIS